MYKYKFFLLLVLALRLVSVAQGQKLEFGISAGGGLAGGHFQVTGGNTDFKSSSIAAWALGTALRWRVNDKFSVIPGLRLAVKGGVIQFDSANIEALLTHKTTHRLSYLALPVGFYYQFKHLFIGAGLYAGAALTGKAKQEKTLVDATGFTETVVLEEAISFDKNDRTAHLRAARFDYGLQGELGYDFKGYRLSLCYEQGLANALPAFDGLASMFQNRVVTVNFAYFFRNARI